MGKASLEDPEVVTKLFEGRVRKKVFHQTMIRGRHRPCNLRLREYYEKGTIMKITKKASAQWSGGIKSGKGNLSTESGALKSQPYGFNTRFEDQPGTNPEELLAVAHAGCFTMALSKIIEEKGQAAESLETTAHVTIEKKGEGFEITTVHLDLQGKVPGMDQAKFQDAATTAKDNCPVSKLFKGNAKISLEARLL